MFLIENQVLNQSFLMKRPILEIISSKKSDLKRSFLNKVSVFESKDFATCQRLN